MPDCSIPTARQLLAAALCTLTLQAFPGLAGRARAQPPLLTPPTASAGPTRPPFLDRTSLILLSTLGGAAVAGKVFQNDAFMTAALDNRNLEGLYGAGTRYGEGVWLSLASVGALGTGLAFHDPRLTNLGRDRHGDRTRGLPPGPSPLGARPQRGRRRGRILIPA